MARARNIKPALFKNEILGVEDPLLSLLFISLWCLADKEGKLEDRPLRIKAETFPYREKLGSSRSRISSIIQSPCAGVETSTSQPAGFISFVRLAIFL